MKLIEKKAYLTLWECTETGMSERTITDAKYQGSKCWDIIDDPDDRRKILVGYDALNEHRKRDVRERWGDPYEVMAMAPILELVKPDHKAYDYFRSYRYGANEHLSIGTQAQYSRGVSWLNFIKKVQADKDMVKKGLKLPMDTFNEHVAALIEVEKKNGMAGMALIVLRFHSG